ncbi:MAG: hypothetical protein ACYSU7_09610 [Planctomycetota bacterium]|jgi:hypothetical protein
MTSFERETRELLERARQLAAEGYERASVVDETRADELAELYDEIGHDVVVLPGAVQGEGIDCHACLQEPGLVTLYVRKKGTDLFS